VYLEFQVQPYTQSVLNDIKREIKEWADAYGVQYTQKTVKLCHRVGFNRDQHFTLFGMTWLPTDAEKRPWLAYRIVNIANEYY